MNENERAGVRCSMCGSDSHPDRCQSSLDLADLAERCRGGAPPLRRRRCCTRRGAGARAARRRSVGRREDRRVIAAPRRHCRSRRSRTSSRPAGRDCRAEVLDRRSSVLRRRGGVARRGGSSPPQDRAAAAARGPLIPLACGAVAQRPPRRARESTRVFHRAVWLGEAAGWRGLGRSVACRLHAAPSRSCRRHRSEVARCSPQIGSSRCSAVARRCTCRHRGPRGK